MKVLPGQGGAAAASWEEILDLDFSGVADHDFKGGGTTLALTPTLGGNVTLEAINQGQASIFKVLSGEFLMNCNATSVDFWNATVSAPRMEFDLSTLDDAPNPEDLVQVVLYGTHPPFSAHSANPSMNVYRRFDGAANVFLNHRAANSSSGWNRQAFDMPGTTGMSTGDTTQPSWTGGLAYTFDARRGGIGLGSAGASPSLPVTPDDVDFIMGMAIRRGNTAVALADTKATVTRLRVFRLAR